ncbi:MAG: tetratricopeptide repeat protein [Anaerolineae bacterium]|nr:tetratricopeptide repeat protein [Anaerolineae bacterium]
MSTADIMLQQAQALIKSGRRAEARPLLEQIVNADDQNEQAWLWLSACVESLDEQRICLENVLMLNPGNQKAIKGLETIRQKLGNTMSSSKPQMPQMPMNTRPVAPPPAQDPYNPYNPASNDTFGSPYDSNQFEQPQMDEGWSPATSVDWGRGGGPAYGSGKKIKEPTASEFDSWVAKLPLDGKKREDPPPPQVMPRRGTADIPPLPVTSTDEQFNIPSSYNAGDDPFRGNFDFDDFQSPQSGASPSANKSVNPFGMATDAPPAAAPQQANFDFDGFDGPFSSGSSNTNDAYNYDQPPQTQSGGKQITNDDWGDFGTPSFTQQDSAADFNVPGGFNDATAEDAYARSSMNSTSAERFSFGDRRAPSGTQGRRSQLPNIESAEGLFSDDVEVHGDIPAPAGVEFADDDALSSSGIFGAAKRTSEGGGAKANKAAPAPYAPSMGPFKAIPPEIQVKSGGGSGRTLLAIVGLLILNVASILVLLFVNLRGMGLF